MNYDPIRQALPPQRKLDADLADHPAIIGTQEYLDGTVLDTRPPDIRTEAGLTQPLG
jgi:hypothetical protein